MHEYELANGKYDYEWKFRCGECDHPCNSAHGVKIHKAKQHKARKKQDFKNRLADRAVQDKKLVKQQALRPAITCEGRELENVFLFKYLGSLFAADGRQRFDIEVRIAKAKVRCGKLRKIFDSKHVRLELKLRLYATAVCSLMTFGAET